MDWPSKVCVVGAGKLGSLIIQRLLTVLKPAQLNICRGNLELLEELANRFPGCNVYETAAEAVRGSNAIVLAVRPQQLPQASAEIEAALDPSQPVISVLTGKSIATLQRYLGTTNLARASTSIALRDGKATTYVYYPKMSRQDKHLCRKIIGLWGHICVTQNEDMVDLTIVEVGAQVGAMAYMLGEGAQVFESLGQEPRHAQRNALLAIEAVARQCRGGKTFAEVVKQVRTAGGITAAWIDDLEARKFSKVLAGGIRASLKRTKELDG